MIIVEKALPAQSYKHQAMMFFSFKLRPHFFTQFFYSNIGLLGSLVYLLIFLFKPFIYVCIVYSNKQIKGFYNV